MGGEEVAGRCPRVSKPQRPELSDIGEDVAVGDAGERGRCPAPTVSPSLRPTAPSTVVRVLPETVANQIAAGEVVERPASVVKELVENALDAGATRIEVAVVGGGAKAVVVDDNGCGMGREDALACLERQATSKIATSADIEHIVTFGFRGEAIPSIASVARFVLTTRPEREDAATELTVVGGTLEHVGAAGRPIGTTVAVRDLFFNVPARRKFLRAPATELARIRATLTAIALAHPAVAFRLKSDGRDLFLLPEGDTLGDRVRALLGGPTADALLPLDHEQGEVRVHGYVSRPDFVRGGTPEQYVFVNRRPATAPQIQYALREAWPVRDRRPVAVLFIELPPEEVDVNVHPAKREVRFRHGNRVIDAVCAAVVGGLEGRRDGKVVGSGEPGTASGDAGKTSSFSRNLGATPLSSIAPIPTPQAPPPRQEALPLSPASPLAVPGSTPPTASPSLTPSNPPLAYPVLRDLPPAVEPFVPPPPPPSEPRPESSSALPWRWLRVADVLEPGYWLVVTDQGYVTVDAKAALERILYERLAPAAEAVASQPLLIPETLRLPPADAERVTRFLPELEACGFGVSAFGDDTFLIDALPVVLAELSPKEMLANLAAELDRTGVRKGLDAWRREVVARSAAKAACGAFHANDIASAERLMAQLARCAMPYATPRGRPVMILTTYRELARRFQRE